MTDDVRPTAGGPYVRPRFRIAAIVWGLVVVALAACLGWYVLDPQRVTATGLALLAAEPRTLAIAGVALVLVIGVVIVIGSLLSVVHRAQDRARARREGPATASAALEPLDTDRT